jgi:hypothetical protein
MESSRRGSGSMHTEALAPLRDLRLRLTRKLLL